MKALNSVLGEKLGTIGLCLVLALFCLLSRPAIAQVQFGQITGLVTDPSGGVVPGATVTVSNERTGVKKATMTDVDGNYLVTPLIVGTYVVTATKTGFKSLTRSGIRLDVAQIARIDVTLPLGQVTQTVPVKAGTAMLQT